MSNTRSFIAHAAGEVGVPETADKLPSSEENLVHHTINLDHLDLDYRLINLVTNKLKSIDKVDLHIE